MEILQAPKNRSIAANNYKKVDILLLFFSINRKLRNIFCAFFSNIFHTVLFNIHNSFICVENPKDIRERLVFQGYLIICLAILVPSSSFILFIIKILKVLGSFGWIVMEDFHLYSGSSWLIVLED